MSSWWLMWMVFMLVFLVPPIGYGWGYRKWGPPYPRYIQRRRGREGAAAQDPAPFDHQAWGWGGDLLWAGLLIWLLWAGWALWWH